MSKKEPLEFRSVDPPLRKEQITNRIGQAYLEKVMALLMWRQDSNPGNIDKDDAGVDYTYGYGHAKIEFQLKSANLVNGLWTWNIADSFEKLKGFYDEEETFLFLVATKWDFDGIGPEPSFEGGRIIENNLTKFDIRVKGEAKKFELPLPQIALIPGKVIMDLFEKTEGNLSIHLSPKYFLNDNVHSKFQKLIPYFSEEKIFEVLQKELQEQDNKYEEKRKKKSNESHLTT